MKKLVFGLGLILCHFITFSQETGTFTDTRDGKTYKTVKIGTQTWMAENLEYKRDIGCWAYNENDNYVSQFGYLYTWETAKTVCPEGWHLPTMDEYAALLANYKDSKAAYKALILGGKSGFSTPFGGYLKNDGEYRGFYFMGSHDYFWGSTALSDSSNAWYLDLGTFDKKEANIYYTNQGDGLSVRCLNDN